VGAKERRKGGDGERELRRLLAAELGDGVVRELGASRDGGHDISGVGPFALECKRAEKLQIREWWAQACRQAEAVGKLPALAYRQSRREWTFVVPLSCILGNRSEWESQSVAYVHIDGFVQIARELL